MNQSRRHLTHFFSAIALLGLLISGIANAEEAAKAPEWKGEISLGYILNQGNTKSESIKTGAKAKKDAEKWRISSKFESYSSKSQVEDDAGNKTTENTAEKYYVEGKYDYKFTEFNYFFTFANYDDDRFTDFDYQASVSFGYGRRLIHTDVHEWDAEIGPGYRVNEFQNGDSTEETIVRLATTYNWKISDSAVFLQEVNVESGEESTVSRSETALTTQINKTLSLKIAHIVKYNDEVPPDTKHADQETIISLLYSF